jgi:dolichol-phosphate mannosyltransferase
MLKDRLLSRLALCRARLKVPSATVDPFKETGVMKPFVSLVVPTLNEAKNIQALLQRAHATLSTVTQSFEIIVVDDSSEDGTANLAEEMSATLANVRVIKRSATRDLSRSVLDGWAAAKGDVLAVIDADLQHPPERLSDLLNPMIDANIDLAVASRSAKGGGVSEWALQRRVISWGATFIATLLVPGVLRVVRDPMSGFFAVRRDVLATGSLDPSGYKILLEVLSKTAYTSVIEIPYIFEERKNGVSKLGPKQATQYLAHVFHLSRSTGEIWFLPKFAVVGLTGVLVNAVVAQSATPLSIALGFECSVFSNFLLNELWTFQGGTNHLAPVQPVLGRLVSFQLIAVIALIANLVTYATMRFGFGASDLICAATAIGVGGICNFIGTTHLTWSLWLEETIMSPGGAVTRRSRGQAAVPATRKEHTSSAL